MSNKQSKSLLALVIFFGVFLAEPKPSRCVAQVKKESQRFPISQSTQNAKPTRGRYNGRIVFSSDRHGSGLSIWTMNPDGSMPTRLTDDKSRTNRLPSFTHVYDLGPVWSPDGTRIAFVSNRDLVSAVYIMNADGRSVNFVTDKVLNPAALAWSPDGNRIALSGGVRVVPAMEGQNPSVHIYVVNVDGSELTKLTTDGSNNDSPAWSPDGKEIAFSSNRDSDSRYKIWVMNADGSNQRRLTDIHNTSNPLFYGDSGPAWSPDGSKILFNGYRDFNGTRNCYVINCSELFVMKADGSNDLPLTNDPNRDRSYAARWSPDGQKIIASRSLGNVADAQNSVNRGTAIIVMNSDGSNQVNISNRGKYEFNAAEYVFVEGSPDWQPLVAPSNFAPSVVGFSAPSYNVYEDAGSVPISVARTGNLNDIASCFYATFDGTATAQRDYAPVLGTLRFAAGEASKTIPIPITNSGDARGNRSFKMVLSDNEGNATFIGGNKEATVTILDRDTVPRTKNPIDDTSDFVRMHYIDFLNREPDEGGWDYWTSQINDCRTDARCVLSRRIGVSAAFFIEQEFQQTGSFVIRFKLINPPYSALNFLAFIRDVQRIEANALGQPDAAAKLEANKQAYIEEYLDEDRITVSWGRTDSEFVDLLFYYVQLYGGATLLQTDRDAYLAGLAAGTETRATIVRKVTDHPLYRQATYNPSFVLMQYYGYLRRDPDIEGYDFWVNVLNNREPNNFRAMVCAFLTSVEYQLRFGSVISHSNSDCS